MYGGKRTTKIRQGLPPSPFSGNARKKTFFLQEGFPKVGFPFSAKSQTYHRNHRKEKNLSIIFILLLELDQNSLKQSLYRCGKTSVCKVFKLSFKLLIPTSSIYRGGSSIKTWIYFVQKRKRKRNISKFLFTLSPMIDYIMI